jgi:hypothetical protein
LKPVRGFARLAQRVTRAFFCPLLEGGLTAGPSPPRLDPSPEILGWFNPGVVQHVEPVEARARKGLGHQQGGVAVSATERMLEPLCKPTDLAADVDSLYIANYGASTILKIPKRR